LPNRPILFLFKMSGRGLKDSPDTFQKPLLHHDLSRRLPPRRIRPAIYPALFLLFYPWNVQKTLRSFPPLLFFTPAAMIPFTFLHSQAFPFLFWDIFSSVLLSFVFRDFPRPFSLRFNLLSPDTLLTTGLQVSDPSLS